MIRELLPGPDYWVDQLPLHLAIAGFGYLLGSIPFGVLITRRAGLGDIRSIGSGNIGATNVLRTGRKDLALATLLLDGGKGAAAILLVRALFAAQYPGMGGFEAAQAFAGGGAFLGHLFPVWLKFKGGKGVATFFGALLAAAWPVGLAAGATWIGIAALFRYSSLAALVAAVLAPTYMLLLRQPQSFVWLAAFMGVLILIRHRMNIARLVARTEPKIGGSKA